MGPGDTWVTGHIEDGDNRVGLPRRLDTTSVLADALGSVAWVTPRGTNCRRRRRVVWDGHRRMSHADGRLLSWSDHQSSAGRWRASPVFQRQRSGVRLKLCGGGRSPTRSWLRVRIRCLVATTTTYSTGSAPSPHSGHRKNWMTDLSGSANLVNENANDADSKAFWTRYGTASTVEWCSAAVRGAVWTGLLTRVCGRAAPARSGLTAMSTESAGAQRISS